MPAPASVSFGSAGRGFNDVLLVVAVLDVAAVAVGGGAPAPSPPRSSPTLTSGNNPPFKSPAIVNKYVRLQYRLFFQSFRTPGSTKRRTTKGKRGKEKESEVI